jgi:hypothetical protein
MSSSAVTPPTGDQLKIHLTEYAKAQDSAEHHDTLLWTVVGILVSGIAALFGFALQYFDGNQPKWKFGLLAVLGMLFSALIWFFVSSFAGIRKQKYDRCIKIEELLGMKNHRDLRFCGCQRAVVYTVGGLFFLTWLILLSVRLSQPFDGRCIARAQNNIGVLYEKVAKSMQVASAARR